VIAPPLPVHLTVQAFGCCPADGWAPDIDGPFTFVFTFVSDQKPPPVASWPAEQVTVIDPFAPASFVLVTSWAVPESPFGPCGP